MYLTNHIPHGLYTVVDKLILRMATLFTLGAIHKVCHWGVNGREGFIEVWQGAWGLNSIVTSHQGGLRICQGQGWLKSTKIRVTYIMDGPLYNNIWQHKFSVYLHYDIIHMNKPAQSYTSPVWSRRLWTVSPRLFSCIPSDSWVVCWEGVPPLWDVSSPTRTGENYPDVSPDWNIIYYVRKIFNYDFLS